MSNTIQIPYNEIIVESLGSRTPRDLNEFNYSDFITEVKNKVAVLLNDNDEMDYNECVSSLSILDQLFEKASRCNAVFKVNNGIATFIKNGGSCKISMTEYTEKDIIDVLNLLES